MRLVYTSDLHGNVEKYQHLFDMAAEHRAQAVVVGGDLLPHNIKVVAGIQKQRDFITHTLQPMLASFRAAHPQTAVYLLPGNDDWAAAITALDDLEVAGLASPLHERVFALEDDLWLAGYACVPITPFSIKDYEHPDTGDDMDDIQDYSFAMAYTTLGGEPVRAHREAVLSRPTIATELERLAQRSDPARTIYVTHTPPYHMSLDMMRNKQVGSRALRAFIERYQPPLTLHGHIHEAPRISGRYTECLGATWCVNPGSERERGSVVVVDTDDIAGTLWHNIYGAAV